MRVDKMVDRILSTRSRLNLETPCPACADPKRDTYCDRCIIVLAEVLDISPSTAKSMYGRKRVGLQQ